LDIPQTLVNYIVFDDPSEKIQLPARRRNFSAVEIVECDAVATVEWIKHSFGITLQLAFVFHENIEQSPGARHEHDVFFLRVV
jgi:hypothetical protein